MPSASGQRHAPQGENTVWSQVQRPFGAGQSNAAEHAEPEEYERGKDARQQGLHGAGRLVVRGNLAENLLGIGPYRENAGNRHLTGRENRYPNCRKAQRPASMPAT